MSDLEAMYREVSMADMGKYEPDLACYTCQECGRTYWFTGGVDSDEPCEHLQAYLEKHNS